MVSADLKNSCGYMLGHRLISGPPVRLTRSAEDSETAMESKSVSHCGLSCWIVPKTTVGARSYLQPIASYYRICGIGLMDWSRQVAGLAATNRVP